MLKMESLPEEVEMVIARLSKVEYVCDGLEWDVKGSLMRKASPPPIMLESLERV